MRFWGSVATQNNKGGENMKIMNPKHKLWDEFIERLEGMVNNCKCGRSKNNAKLILKTMPNIDIRGSMQYFNKNGGCCDCEIYLNV